MLGDKLKTLRIQHGLTQVEVAERIGVSKSIISYYETSERQPSYEALIKLASLYKVTTDYLLGIETKKTVEVTGLSKKQLDLVLALIDTFKHP